MDGDRAADGGFCSLPVTIMVYLHHGVQMKDKHSALSVLDQVCTYCAAHGFTKLNSHLHIVYPQHILQH